MKLTVSYETNSRNKWRNFDSASTLDYTKSNASRAAVSSPQASYNKGGRGQYTPKQSQQSRPQSRYDTSVWKKPVTVDIVRKLIFEAFKEFRGHELAEAKLAEFEERICQNSYMISQEKAVMRIVELVESCHEDDMNISQSTYMSDIRLSTQSRKVFCKNKNKNMNKEVSIDTIQLK